MLLRATGWHMCAAPRVPVCQEPGPQRGRAPSKRLIDLRVEARTCLRCDGQLFFVAEGDGEALAALEADVDGEGDAGVELAPVPPPVPLAVVTAATASFTAFSAAFVNASALGALSPA